MILGATHRDILTFGIVLVVAMGLGILYICLTFFRMISKKWALRFIYDAIYAIITNGVFIMLMLRLTYGDIEYYHIMALMMGITLAGILPSSLLNMHKAGIQKWADSMRIRISKSKILHIITK